MDRTKSILFQIALMFTCLSKCIITIYISWVSKTVLGISWKHLPCYDNQWNLEKQNIFENKIKGMYALEEFCFFILSQEFILSDWSPYYILTFFPMCNTHKRVFCKLLVWRSLIQVTNSGLVFFYFRFLVQSHITKRFLTWGYGALKTTMNFRPHDGTSWL